tara:strand:- start:6040 stop:7224 length:1185 start_codon:yes stop_codon:yes gene_type:complete
MSGESKDDVLLGVASGPQFSESELTYGGVTSISFSADGRNIVSEVRDTQNYMSDISLYDHSCRGKPKLEFLLDYAYNLFDYIEKYSPEWFVSVDSNVASVITSTMWDTVQLNIQDDLIRTWTQGNITHVQFADSHKHRALTADRGGIVAVWNTESENTLATYQTISIIKSLLFSPDGRLAVFSYDYNSFTVWDLKEKTVLKHHIGKRKKRLRRTFTLCSFSPDMQHIAGIINRGKTNAELFIMNLTGKILHARVLPRVTCIAWDPLGFTFACGFQNRTTRLIRNDFSRKQFLQRELDSFHSENAAASQTGMGSSDFLVRERARMAINAARETLGGSFTEDEITTFGPQFGIDGEQMMREEQNEPTWSEHEQPSIDYPAPKRQKRLMEIFGALRF